MHRVATLTQSTLKFQHLNMAEYMMENVEDDHYLDDFFPKAIPHHLQPLIDSPVPTTFVAAPPQMWRRSPQLWRPDILKIANYPLKTLENLFLFGN